MDTNNTNQIRPPIVVVLGHVDHGKTTLLDAIRKSDVTKHEAGGITQKIGASVIELPTQKGVKDGRKITFIDTPGHAAFTKMRGRGVKVADIAVLVVAQDDGVKPQTKEALQIIRDAGIAFIVAGTKADVVGVSPEKLLGELEKMGVFFEGRGGDTPFVSVSAKANIGIIDLLENLILMADVAGLAVDIGGGFEAVVIESGKDKMGAFASAVIRSGRIKVGEIVYTGEIECKVRALFDDNGKAVKEAEAGYPVKILGFSEIPTIGSSISKSSIKVPKDVVKRYDIFDLRRLKDDEIPVVIKADNAGSLEAIIASLPPKVVVVGQGVGNVTSSDIIDAKVGNAYVFAFESKIPPDVRKLADAEGVKVERFQIIYELISRLDEILRKGEVEILGRAEVLALFPFDNKKVAGCKVISGRISEGDNLVLQRGEKVIGKGKIISLRKQKIEVSSVGQSEEFGIIVEPQLDFVTGDVVVSVAK